MTGGGKSLKIVFSSPRRLFDLPFFIVYCYCCFIVYCLIVYCFHLGSFDLLLLLFRSAKGKVKRNSSGASNGKMQKMNGKTEIIPEPDTDTGAENGKVDIEESKEEMQTKKKVEEGDDYDEIKVIQENIVTINEKIETRF